MSQELQASYDFTKEQIKELEQLRKDLAEREAECLKYRDALTKCQACIGDNVTPDLYGADVDLDEYLRKAAIEESEAVELAQKALSTPPRTSYLEQWVTDNFKVAAFEWRANYSNGGYTSHLCYDRVEAEGWNEATLTDGVVTPLYARED